MPGFCSPFSLLWQAGLSGCDFSAPALYTASYMDVFDTVLTLRIASTSRTAADNAAAAVHARMLELHREFDIYHDWAGMNNLKTVNDHAGDGKTDPGVGGYPEPAGAGACRF